MLEGREDIFDLRRLLQDWREDAAVTGGVRHQEEKVAGGNLLHHERPAAERLACGGSCGSWALGL